MTDTPTGFYVYGVAESGALDLPRLSPGLRNAEVTLVEAAGLAAITTPEGPDLVEPTRRFMLGHTAVLERAMQDTTVLPMRFGTVAPDRATLERCLAANAHAFRTELARIEGRVELGIKAFWREGLIYREIVDRDPALRSLRDRLARRAPSETYYERIELGRRVEAALGSRREAEANALLAPLAPLADTVSELRQLDERMILNRAFLVKRDAERAFDAAVADLTARNADRIEFKYVGPVPPYTFVTLYAGWLGPVSG